MERFRPDAFRMKVEATHPRAAPVARRWDRGAWLACVVALLLTVAGLGQRIYRFTLPTDGWAFNVGTVGGDNQDRPEYWSNILGMPSPLQRGDWLLAVNGVPYEEILGGEMRVPPQATIRWEAGQTVRYTVLRGGDRLTLPVVLYRWPIWGLVRAVMLSQEWWLGLALTALGWFVFLKRPGEWAARALLLFTTALAQTLLSSMLVNWNIPELSAPPLGPLAGFFSNLIFAAVLLPSAALLALTFPHPKRLVRRYPVPIAAALYGLIWLLLLTLGSGRLAIAGWGSTLVFALSTIAILAHTWVTTRDPTERAQVRWAAAGLAAGLLCLVALVLSGLGALVLPEWPSKAAVFLMALLPPVGFAVAILRYRLFDLDVVINRALVYGALTACIVLIYVFVVGYLGTLFAARGSLVVSLAATGVTAVLFAPLRNALQRGVDRLMYGHRQDPYAVLTRLGERLDAAFAPAEVLPAIVSTIGESLKLPYVAIALADDAPRGTITALPPAQQRDVSAARNWLMAAEHGRPPAGQAGESVVLPLFYQGQTVGELYICPRTGESGLSPRDRRLLDDIAHQAGLAVHGVSVMNELREARQRLVLSREEERRRLRNDLHDDLAPTLAGLAFSATAIADVIPTDPGRATRLAEDLSAAIRATVGEIRRLAYDLRPPALDELGLVAAIRERAAQFGPPASQTTFEVRSLSALPSLPAAVEAAAYRILLEGLMNVSKHAHAGHCQVDISFDGALCLELDDDGIGMPDAPVLGLGLRSMRERAEELNGACVAERVPGGGTRIKISIPIPEGGSHA